jgi:hydroxyacylglutathione hydrolase
VITITPVPALRDNYIWTVHDGQHAIVVDPGDAQPVQDFLQQQELTLVAIFCTHWQKDHSGGICQLASDRDIPVYGPIGEEIACITHRVGEGEVIDIPALTLAYRVMEIPGHTRGHIAFAWKGGIFCGDTLFGAGCGRVFDGTLQQLHHSLQRLAELPDDTLIYCSHEYTEANLEFARECEPDNSHIAQRITDTRALRATGQPSLPSTLALEKATNPFLRCALPQVARQAESHVGHALNDEFSVFSALRQWKNRY